MRVAVRVSGRLDMYGGADTLGILNGLRIRESGRRPDLEQSHARNSGALQCVHARVPRIQTCVPPRERTTVVPFCN